MNPLGLETAQTPVEQAAPVQIRLHIINILASAQRFWIRGQVEGLPVPLAPAGKWWPLLKKHAEPAAARTVHLETQVSGQVLRADVPLDADGTFAASFDIKLPPARRGWRVARNQVTVLDQKTEVCAVVAELPEQAAGALVVLLPRSETLGSSHFQILQEGIAASQRAELLHRLHKSQPGGQPFFYLACVPPGRENAQAELALAITALGWPAGTMLLSSTGDSGLAEVLDRLRWLLAGQVELHWLNLDAAAVQLDSCLTPAADRATVRPLNLSGEQLRAQSSAGSGQADRRANTELLRSRRPTLNPLVFCHGMLAFTMLRMQLSKELNYFSALSDFLKERGFRALFPQVIPTGGVIERAAELREQILAWTAEPVNLIAHSMGGLDARYLITHLGMAKQVSSLTTIATPHRGTYLADWFQANYRRRVPLLLALEALGVNVDGFRDCQLAACREFNLQTPDVPGVRYFSYGGEVPQSRVNPTLRRGWALLTHVEGPNDGLVSVASARWGEYLGTIHADHFAQTPDSLFVRPNESFDSLGFMTRLLDELAWRGL